MKDFFKYDIAKHLKHKKLKININRTLSINEDIINIINEGFSDSSNYLKEKAKAFIKFYPKNKEDNNVVQFIDSYKAITRENFTEEEINTNNISLWGKAINILLFDLLEIIQNDGNINETSKRIELDEDKTIDKLNIFYSILFNSNIKKEKIKKFFFIPNEKGIYKRINDVYFNKDIDEKIKEVLNYLDENLSFDHILIHHKLKLNIIHSQKRLEDIANVIDKEIKKNYDKIDKMIQKDKENVKIEENFQKSCQLLLQNWFKEHKDKIKLFEFTYSHLVDISVKILFDEKTKKIFETLLIEDPLVVIDMIKFNDPYAPFLYDESMIEQNEDSSLSSSFDATLDNSRIQRNQNNIFNLFNAFNNNNNNNYNYQNNNNNYYNYHNINYNRRRRHRYNYVNNANFGNIYANRYDEEIKKYCKAQAYVYQKLLDSNLFSQIDWKNKLNENEEGELIILSNGLRYKVKKDYSNYDFIIKTKHDKNYKISVKIGENKSNSDIDFNFRYSQWISLNSELKSIVFAFVSLKNENNPEIYFSRNLLLDEL